MLTASKFIQRETARWNQIFLTIALTDSDANKFAHYSRVFVVSRTPVYLYFREALRSYNTIVLQFR